MEQNEHVKASVGRQKIAFFILLLFIGFLTYLVIGLSQRVSTQEEALNSSTEAAMQRGRLGRGSIPIPSVKPPSSDDRPLPCPSGYARGGDGICMRSAISVPLPSTTLERGVSQVGIGYGKCGDICRIGDETKATCQNGETCNPTGQNISVSEIRGSDGIGQAAKMVYSCSLPGGGCAPLKENESCYSKNGDAPASRPAGTCEAGTSCRCYGVLGLTLGMCRKDTQGSTPCPTN